MSAKSTFIAKLLGIRPIMFDRYGGDNKTKLEAKDKAYLNERGECCIPTLNIFSLLCAQNTPSVAKLFYGKAGREAAMGIMAFVNIEAVEDNDPFMGVLRDSTGKAWTMDDKRVSVVRHVARLAKGVPNPKERPMLPTDWSVSFRFELQDNKMVNENTLRKMITEGGILGLGTFRPIFGRYRVEFSE